MIKKTFVFFLIAIVLWTCPKTAKAAPCDAEPCCRAMLMSHVPARPLFGTVSNANLCGGSEAAELRGCTGLLMQSMGTAGIKPMTGAGMLSSAGQLRSCLADSLWLSAGDVKTAMVYFYSALYSDRGALFAAVGDILATELPEDGAKSLTAFIYIAGSGVILVLLLLLWLLMKSRERARADKEEIANLNALGQMYNDANRNLVYLKDENLKYVFVNKAVEEFYQKPASEIAGSDDFSLSENEFAQKRRKSDLAVLETKAPVVSETQWQDRLYQATKFPVKLPKGCLGVGAYVRDITEERADEIRRAQAFHRNQILLNIFSRGFESNQELLDYTLRETVSLISSEYGYIHLYDESKRELTLQAWTSEFINNCGISESQTVYNLDEAGLWGEVIRSRKPLIVNDFQHFPLPVKEDPPGCVNIETFMSVPVIIDERVVAAIGLANKPKGYNDNDVYETTLLMSGLWNALQGREARQKLFYERNKTLQALMSIGDGVMVVDQNGRVDMLNAVAAALTGWTFEEAQGKHYKEIFLLSHDKDGYTVDDPIEGVLSSGQVQDLSSHAILTSRDGTRYILEDSSAPIHDEAGHMVGVVLVFRDATDKIQQRNRIEYLSFHDSLTGLYNRRFFEEELFRLDTARNLPLSLVMADVNNLKLTNDIFGHACGDLLLIKVAEVLKKTCRADDIIARWGGDEFVLLLPNTTFEETKGIVTRIKAEFAKEEIMGIKGSISIGTGIKQQPPEIIGAVFNDAEEKMYAAKTLEREDVYKSAMEAIVSLLHRLNAGEKEHAVRVSALCQAMGRALHLQEDDVKKLGEAGYLHDIGKIVLDPAHLGKSSSLWSPEEWKEFRRHPLVGYRILNFFDATRDLAEPVLTHQESWDGSGYPKGLAGNEIPLWSRIIAIAESYDRKVACTQGCEALSPREALGRISDLGGKRFDPYLADLFVRTMEDAFIREEDS